MYRKSIYENNERYYEAVTKVFELKRQGCNEEEIPNKLANLYQENEITGLIKDINRLPELNGNKKLKSMLKVSLWVLLFIKLLLLPFIVIPAELATVWKIIIPAISLLITGLSLYLIYKQNYEIVFSIVLLTFVISTDTFIENIYSLFTVSILTLGWWLGLLMNLSLLIALYSSWKLFKKYPRQLLKLEKIVRKDNLIYMLNGITRYCV
jgi:hypothetical protein